MDYVKKIIELRGISENVDTFVANDYIRLKYENAEDISDQLVLNECYGVLIQELQEYGLFLSVDLATALADYYQADGFLAIRELLQLDNLVLRFKMYPELHASFEAMLCSEDADESDHFRSFLNLYRHVFPNDNTTTDRILRIEDLVYSNSEFKLYILDTLTRAVPESSITTADDVANYFEFVKSVHRGQLQFKYAVESVWDIDDHLDQQYLTKAIATYDNEKITGNTIASYMWAVMTKPEDLNPEDQTRQTLIIDRHKYHNSHHIEYYILRHLTPNKSNMLELSAHHAEPDTTLDEYKAAIDDMIELGRKNNVLTEETEIPYINMLATHIARTSYKDGKIVPIKIA